MGKENILDLLLLACKSGNIEKIESFLEDMDDFDVNMQYTDGLTLLMLASEYTNEEVVRLLLQHGANVNIQKDDGTTALMIATSDEGNLKVIEILLEGGANTDIQGGRGLTALMYACLFGYKDIVKILLKHGANVNLQSNPSGGTALMLAGKEGHKDIVKLLLEHGADPYIQDKRLNTAVMLADKKGYKDIVELLLEHSMENRFAKDFGTHCLELGSKKGTMIYYMEPLLLGGLVFHDVNTCYMNAKTSENMMISVDFINRIDLYTLLLEELDKRGIINAQQVLSAINFQPIDIDFTDKNIIIDNVVLAGTLGEKEIAVPTGEIFYPIIATELKFVQNSNQ